MSWHVVSMADAPSSSWRNGGGVTRELACWPQATDWIWRMFLAEVDQSGHFPVLRGVELVRGHCRGRRAPGGGRRDSCVDPDKRAFVF